MPSSAPILTIQTATLGSTTDGSTFTGTGGPQPYDPYFGVFDGVVSSQGLSDQPFHDQLFGVDGSDQVEFVIAIQNFAATAAYNIKVRDYIPVGFVLPPDGPDVAVSSGAGQTLAWTGNLFDANSGLTLSAPLAAYDQNSGANVALITFTLDATSALPVPSFNMTSIAQIVSYAASNGGPNLSGRSTTSLTDSSPLQTAAIGTASVADQPATTLASGQTASYDITITLPEGTTDGLNITEALPASGNAQFRLVSATVTHLGSNLSASGPLAAQSDGTIALGRVVDTPDGVSTAADQITVRVTVANGGTSAGTGTLQTTVSAADPNVIGNRWSTTLTNTSALATPDVPPTIAGASARQAITSAEPVLPFATLSLADPDAGQAQTLTIHLSDSTLGSLSGPHNANGDVVLTGAVGAVQSAARALLFTPAAGGIETLSLTLDDGATGIATNSQTTLTITAPAHPVDITHYASSAQTVLTSTPSGTTTTAPTETYAGPVDAITNQFVYDGTDPLAIIAQSSNMLITSAATATAISFLGGSNTADLRAGSGFITSGTGADTILLHANTTTETWSTLVNAHAGDQIVLYGVGRAANVYWDANAGAPGYTGATLRADLNNDGRLDSSVTFAGKTQAALNPHLTYSNVGGSDFLSINF